MIAVLLFLISVFGYSLFYKYIFKEFKFGTLVFISYSSMTILMYLFFIFSKLKIGAYTVISLGLVLFAVFVIKFRKNFKFKNIVSPASTFFALITILLLVLTLTQKAYMHDDFSHWIKAVKQMYFYDQYFVPFTPLDEDGYMPAYLPICYAVCKFFSYSEGVIYIIKSFGLITILAWFLEMISSQQRTILQKYLSSLIASSIFFMFPIFNSYSYGFNTLLVDLDLGTFFGIGIIYTVFFDKFAIKSKISYFLPIYLCIICLTTLKLGTGILFSYIIIISILISYLGKFKYSIKSIAKDKSYILILILLPIITNYSWNVCYNYNKNIVIQKELNNPPNNNYKISELIKSTSKKNTSASYALFGPMDNYKNSIIQKYISTIFSSVSPFTKTISIFVYILALFVLGIFLLILSPRDIKKKIFKALILISFGAILFLIGLYIIYVNFIKFSAEEYRYTGTIFTAYLILLSYMCGVIFNYKIKGLVIVRSILAIFIITFFTLVNKNQYIDIFYKPVSNKYYFSHQNEKAETNSIELKKYLKANDKKTIYISKDESSLSVYAFEYYSLPKRIRYLNFSWYQNIELIKKYLVQYDVDYIVIDPNILNISKEFSCLKLNSLETNKIKILKIIKGNNINFECIN